MGGVFLERRRSGVLIVTDTKERLLVHPVTKYYALPEGQVKAVYFPLRPGYSTTLHKIQGATVPHLTVWLDMKMEAAAYVALSRVQYDKNWRFLATLPAFPKRLSSAALVGTTVRAEPPWMCCPQLALNGRPRGVEKRSPHEALPSCDLHAGCWIGQNTKLFCDGLSVLCCPLLFHVSACL